MTSRPVLAVILSLSLACAAFGIDRGAAMVDHVSLDISRHSDGESIGGTLWGEAVLAPRDENWAILFGGSYGTIMMDAGFDIDYWRVALGLKYYLLPGTSLSALGSYMQLDVLDDPDIVSAEGYLKHRLGPHDADVSPYILGGVMFRNVERIPEQPDDKRFQEIVVVAGGGCDFMAREDLAFTFELTWNGTEGIGDEETPNWWLGSFAMKYFWSRED